MTWQRHPGIWFTLYACETVFLLAVLSAITDFLHPRIEGSIQFAWAACMLWGVTHYHGRWVEKTMERLSKR